jgi:hypothetical protein
MVVYPDGLFVQSLTGSAFLCADWVFSHHLLIFNSILQLNFMTSHAALLLNLTLTVQSAVQYSYAS